MTPGFSSGAICGHYARAKNAENNSSAADELPPNSSNAMRVIF